jgi:glycosyltransferase involved in cell wall biosynthesis
MYRGRSIGVVIPAYNESGLILETLRSIPPLVDSIYVIDDGSTDDTPKKVKEHNDSRVMLVQHAGNRGVGAAILTGYRQSLANGMDVTAVMDGDNQMDPSYLTQLLDPIVEDVADYAKGNRLTSASHIGGMSAWRYFGNCVLSILTKVASGYWHISDSQNGYIAISKQALQKIIDEPIFHYYGYCNDILIKLGAHDLRVKDVPMPSRYGREVSKIRYGRYIVKVSFMLLRGYIWRLTSNSERQESARISHRPRA